MRHLAFVLATTTILFASGCVRVKPYEREHLSLRAMTPGADITEERFRQHWQTSREASEGGYGAVGGGCGCN